jgi:high-affinity iron transporter
MEVCLLVGIISAALNNLVNKRAVIVIGIISGMFFSSIIAFSLNKISTYFNGYGQEILNIFILSLSIICIAITLIWMNHKGKELYAKVSDTGKKVIASELNILSLWLIISFAITREGSELALFLHGVYATGTKINDLLLGCFIGAGAGIFLGILLSKGLLKVSAKYFFKIINFTMTILAASMSAKLANYLMAIDLVPGLTEVIWDSSSIISDDSVLGNILHNLLGYVSKPSKIEILFYSVTILSIFILISYSKAAKKIIRQ